MANNTATAPYNFVPLPRRVLFIPDDQIPPPYDRWDPDRYSGYLNLTATLETPLFIGRPGRPESGGSREPFAGPDGRPVIPGSSLRGCLRTLVEILSFSKISNVTDEKPFYRSVGDDPVAQRYRDQMLRNGAPAVRAGRLYRDGSRWYLEPRRFVKVSHQVLRASGTNPQGQPWMTHYGARVYLDELRPSGPLIRAGKCSFTSGPGKPATFVPSGPIPNKRSELAILDERDGERIIEVHDRVIERFNSEDQLTQWQEQRFPKGSDRAHDGWLKDGELVFFVEQLTTIEGGLFLGRPGMFRLPYDASPRSLLSAEHTSTQLDLAEAIFGRVRAEDALRGRVRVGDLTAIEEVELEPEIRLAVLSSPKITNVAHYLVQASGGATGQGALKSYFRDNQSALRGHKLYWHRCDQASSSADQVGARPGAAESQTRTARLVPKGTRFEGRIYFENLTSVELGALMAAVRLWPTSRHHLGLGKPLGLGSVHIVSKCHTYDIRRRYQSWHDAAALVDDDADAALGAFAGAVRAHCQGHEVRNNNWSAPASGEPPPMESLRSWARLDALARLVEWDARPAPSATATMKLDDFKAKRRLPEAEVVAGATAQPWSAPPEDGPPEVGARRTATLTGRNKKGNWEMALPGTGRLAVFDATPPGQESFTEGQEIRVEIVAVPGMPTMKIVVKLTE